VGAGDGGSLELAVVLFGSGEMMAMLVKVGKGERGGD